MKIILLLTLVLSTACSTDTRRKYASEELLKLEDDYNWVDSLDFDKKVEQKYNPSSDEFAVKKEDEKKILIKESVSVLNTPRLEEQLKDTNDPLSKIVIQCYQNKFEEAFLYVNQIYSQYKNNTSYWNQVGTCYYLKGDYSKAILFYNKSRDLDPKFTPPVNNLGVVYQKQGRFQKALSAYKKAGEINAFSITPAFNSARLYLQFGIVAKAEPILSGLYKKSTDDVQVTSALASCYLLKGDYQNAANLFSQIPKEQLSSPSIGLNYSLTLKFLNKNEEATSMLKQVSESAGELKQYAQKVEAFVGKQL